MMTMQVQAVIYNNEVSAVGKMVESFANAAAYYNRKSNEEMVLRIVLGEASPRAVLNNEIIQDFRKMCNEQVEIEYLEFGFNSGYGKGHNIIAEKYKADFLCIINPDIMPMATFFCEMLAPFENKETGITEARQTPIEHPKEYDKQTRETDWSSGACFIIRGSLFDELKGFDTDTFFMYSEDVDLSWRVRNLGYKLIYCPEAPVFHAKKLTNLCGWNASESEYYYSAISQMLLAWKWGEIEKAEALCKQYKESDSELFHKAAAVFEEKKDSVKPRMKRNFEVDDRVRFLL